jgi:hypothetical protein
MDGQYASGFAAYGGLLILDGEDPNFGKYIHEGIPEEYIEVFSSPDRAWYLYDFQTNTWIPRDKPEDWQG